MVKKRPAENCCRDKPLPSCCFTALLWPLDNTRSLNCSGPLIHSSFFKSKCYSTTRSTLVESDVEPWIRRSHGYRGTTKSRSARVQFHRRCNLDPPTGKQRGHHPAPQPGKNRVMNGPF
ncbi:uncharacterized protein AAG666_023619 isoform 2-T15 [Megaptera novaeangliae]